MTTTATYDVKGMTCDHCVKAVSTELAKVVGVRDITVDLASGRVTVTSDDPVDPAVAHAAVEAAGYELTSEAST